jgi:hypothetical protein
MSLDKAEVARRLLGTALALFLDDKDAVSVHTLACAGSEIAEYLACSADKKSFSTHALESVPNLDIGKLRRIQRQYCNAFKHASEERDDGELLKSFDDEQNNHLLFVGWYDYGSAVGMLPIEAQLFQVWYFALYPEKLDPKVDTRPYTKTFPQLSIQSPAMRKDVLRQAIAYYMDDTELRNNAQTDSRPLILPAG